MRSCLRVAIGLGAYSTLAAAELPSRSSGCLTRHGTSPGTWEPLKIGPL